MKEGRGAILFQVIFFGLSAIGILILTWSKPMPGSERVLSTLIGAAGVFIALLKARRLWTARALAQAAVKGK